MDKKRITAAHPVHARSNPPWHIHFKGLRSDDIRLGFLSNLEYNIAKDQYTFTSHDEYLSIAYTVRERLIERWILTQQEYHKQNIKRVYYLSFEFLLGRLLRDNMLNLGIHDATIKALRELGLDFDHICDQEPDAGLGNGGLGRLAACFLDSMACLELPAIGYGIRYEFGIFKQKIVNGHQQEFPEEWLQFGNPWEIERPEYRLPISYFGKVVHPNGGDVRLPAQWIDTEQVVAIPFDTPIPGFRTNTVNTLRLWAARSANEFDLADFNSGDYIGAVHDKLFSESISKVLYPNDNNHSGRELRLKQQHFFTSASLQDIIRRFLRHNENFDTFPEKATVQLNDTHPAIAIAELMRLLVDAHSVPWAKAWGIVQRTFAYTNHTLMPEALEKWPVSMVKNLLPRHMEIIYEINKGFLEEVGRRFPGDHDRLRRMSFIEEGPERYVRMAHLAVVGSYSVNGVARLHTQLLTTGLLRDFSDLWPERFNNKTNGITPRRWLYKANPGLSALITETIGDGWIRNLDELRKLAPFAQDAAFREQWRKAKLVNKQRLAVKLREWQGIQVDPESLFDVQVKRIHEYKRQLLNILHCIHLYDEVKAGRTDGFVPRTVLFGGKAAPGYFMAKLMIKFVNNIGGLVNADSATQGLLSVHFVPDYRVTVAEYLMPAADLSEQISTAGTEASGTGNMKFALNGALTIGTMDGANIEICEEVGEENMFIFGLRTREVEELRSRGYNPWEVYNRIPALKSILDRIRSGFFSPGEPDLFKPIAGALLDGGDRYMVLADFESYVASQTQVNRTFLDQEKWTAMSILNTAGVGKFSSDRTIRQYNEEIWKAPQVPVKLVR